MKLNLALVFAGISLYFSAIAGASATTIDFSVYPENTAITDQFAGQGVTFQGLEEGAQVAIVTANFSSQTGDTYLSNCYPTRCDQRADVVEVTFSSPASNVSFGLDSEGSLEVVFNAYDSNDNLLETFSATSDGGTVGFTTGGISRIDMLQQSDDWGWGFANLTFDASGTAAAIPTMSFYGAILLVMALLLFAGRRLHVTGKRH